MTEKPKYEYITVKIKLNFIFDRYNGIVMNYMIHHKHFHLFYFYM